MWVTLSSKYIPNKAYQITRKTRLTIFFARAMLNEQIIDCYNEICPTPRYAIHKNLED